MFTTGGSNGEDRSGWGREGVGGEWDEILWDRGKRWEEDGEGRVREKRNQNPMKYPLGEGGNIKDKPRNVREIEKGGREEQNCTG